MIGFCVPHGEYRELNPTSQKELPRMEQSGYKAEPRLTIFVFLHFYQAGIHTMTRSIQFTSKLHTHTQSFELGLVFVLSTESHLALKS